MSSKVLDIYDAIVDLIEATLPTHKRLPNPYVVDQNTYAQMTKGFGMAIGTGFDTERFVCDLVTWQRSFTIILVQRITTTQNNIGSRETIEKAILEDHDKLRKAFYLNSSLGEKAIKSTVSSDSGPTFVDADLLKFFTLEINLNVEYLETANS